MTEQFFAPQGTFVPQQAHTPAPGAPQATGQFVPAAAQQPAQQAPAAQAAGQAPAAAQPQAAFNPMGSYGSEEAFQRNVARAAQAGVGGAAAQVGVGGAAAQPGLGGAAAQATATVPAAPAAQAPAPAAQPGVGRRVGSEATHEGDIDLNAALRQMVAMGASDLHLTSGSRPMVRVDGHLQALEQYPMLKPDALQRTLYSIVSQKQRDTFEEHLELDFAYALIGEARFRVNLYQQRDSLGAAFRIIPSEIKTLESLGVPASVSSFASKPRGLVLVTGPTGSGKSTTLASIIDLVNRQRAAHIMTVEDPIEFLHRHKKSLVNQREVGADTLSFGNALKHVLRQDPDVILIGEMRDIETISVALTAAETGHLVFGTLHTQDTAQTIDRVIDVFPAEQQAQVRTQLATAIQGVVCQALCKRSDGPGRAVATEVMVATPAIRNLIREGKTHQIYSMLQAGSKQGMHTMDQHLAELVRGGRISYETGIDTCHNIEDFNRLCGRSGGAAVHRAEVF